MNDDIHAYAAEVPERIVDALRSVRRLLVVCHENPDADAVGAALGVCRLVEMHGGEATPVCTDPIPALYSLIPGVERFRTDPEPGVDYEKLLIVDCGTIQRVGEVAVRNAELFAKLPRMIIDHHPRPEPAGAGEWIETGSAAVCEMIALLAVRLGVDFDRADHELATDLMAGIVMDTATFAHPNTTPRTLAVAAALLDAGAPMSEISRRIYRSKPNGQLRLFGRVLARLEETPSGRVAWSTFLDEDLRATATEPSQGEGLIDLLSQSETADVVLLFKEGNAHRTRVSIRTRPGGVDATQLAGLFGGGGHARASGATLEMPVPEAIATFVEAAEKLASAIDPADR